jgi:NAD(P)-dependent dehydrogenase (short-subunit alcohol dehydrogenase family)
VLVNNAGINRTPQMEGKDVFSLTSKDWDNVIYINLKGSFFAPERPPAGRYRKSKFLVAQTIVFDGGQTLLAATYH